jgi:putative membrane protein
MYNNNYFWGMDLIWWFVWLALLFWIFAVPYNIPFQRNKKESPLDILQKRLALGQITTDEYQEMKKIIEQDLIK